MALRGMTRKELASATGIPYSSLGKFLRDDAEPRSSQLLKIARALEVRMDELVVEEVGV